MAWNVPNFSLAGQPALSANWAAPLMGVVDDARKQQKASDVLLARQEAANAVGPDGKPNYSNAYQVLMGKGDLEGARAYAQMADSEADNAFREQESKRSQANADRSYSLQAQNAGRGDWGVEKVTNADGSESLIRYNKASGDGIPQGGSISGPKPVKTTEAQNRNSQLYTVMAPEISRPDFETDFKTLSGFQNSAANQSGAEIAMTAPAKRARDNIKTVVSNYLYSVSGAQAPDSEVERQSLLVTPRWNDSADQVKDKYARIQTMAGAVKTAAGPAYKEPEAKPQQPKPATKNIGGRNYIQVDGQWYQQ